MRHQAFCLCTYRELTTENIFCLAVSCYLTTFATMDFVYQKIFKSVLVGSFERKFPSSPNLHAYASRKH